MDLVDAQLAIARWYSFHNWPGLPGTVLLSTATWPPWNHCWAETRNWFERARTRITHFDPPVHRATLLHYTGANGVA